MKCIKGFGIAWVIAGCFAMASPAVMAKSAPATRAMTLITETFHDGSLDSRTLADVSVTLGPDRKSPIKVRLESVRVLGRAQDLLLHKRPNASFEITLGGEKPHIPAIDDIRTLAHEDISVRDAVADLLAIYASNMEPFDRPMVEPSESGRRRPGITTRARPKPEAEPVLPAETTLGNILVRDSALGQRLPVSLQCARVTDTHEERTEDLDVFHTVFNVPDTQCDALLGYGRDRVDNVFRVERSGLDWRYVSGTRLMEIQSVLDRRTGHLESAAAVLREDLAIRDFCTRHGRMCADPWPLSIQRRIEFAPALD